MLFWGWCPAPAFYPNIGKNCVLYWQWGLKGPHLGPRVSLFVFVFVFVFWSSTPSKNTGFEPVEDLLLDGTSGINENLKYLHVSHKFVNAPLGFVLFKSSTTVPKNEINVGGSII